MTALQLAADILAGVFLCLLFAAVYVAVKVEQEEKAGGLKTREVSMVRCKFVCQSKVPLEGNASISLGVVYSGSDENKAFFAATPGGQIQFYTVNEEAAKHFEIGKEYYVDFTPAEAPKEEGPAE